MKNNSTLQETTSSVQQYTLLLFAVTLFIISGNSPGLGQSPSFAPVPYHFPDVPQVTFATNYLPEGQNVISMHHQFSTMAANGYGQWVYENSTNSLWMLLANSSSDANSTTTPPIPNEVVGWGRFNEVESDNGMVKVATNLSGSVRYVWPNADNPQWTHFVIEGLNDQSFTGVDPLNEDQIDISFNGIPKMANSRSTIKKPIYTYPHINANLSPVIDDDRDWRDHFDVAMDRNFLYIVWTEVDPAGGAPFYTKYIVKGVAMNLHTRALTNLGIGVGYRPTVACDPRNAPDQPTCDVAWIKCNNIQASGNTFLNGVRGIAVMHVSIVNGVVGFPVMLDKFCFEPTTATDHYDASNLSVQPFGGVLHVRMLVSSTSGAQLVPPAKAIYVLRYYTGMGDPNSDGIYQSYLGELILYKYDNLHQHWATKIDPNSQTPKICATYVDGLKLTSSRGGSIRGVPPDPYDPNSTTFDYGKYFPIYDAPLVAFANPYDGQRDNDQYEEYHCLYQLYNAHFTGTMQDQENDRLYPLFMVRDDNNKIVNNGVVSPFFNEPDTRTMLGMQIVNGNKLWLPNPLGSAASLQPGDEYCAAINQMGIHVRWNAQEEVQYTMHSYYSRDPRRFDEDIDENTLLTYECQVGDGSSHDGSSNTPTLLPGRTLSLWTNPVFAVSTDGIGTNSGIYVAGTNPPGFHNARLIFDDDNTILKIGDPSFSGSWGANGRLICMPNYEIHFADGSIGSSGLVTHGQEISISPKSQFEYYGIPPTNSLKSNFVGAGKISLLENGILNIHAGAEFLVPDYCTLEAIEGTGAYINLLHEPSIIPVYTSTDPLKEDQTSHLNVPADGKITFAGTGNFTRTNFVAQLPFALDASPVNLITIRSNLFTSTAPLDQFTANNCIFSGGCCWGTGVDFGYANMELLCTNSGGGSTYRNVLIENSSFSSAGIKLDHPYYNVDITSSSFTRMGLPAIVLLGEPPSSFSSHVNLNSNTITNGTFAPPNNGIYVSGASAPRTASPFFDEININNNVISILGNDMSTNSSIACIYLLNTSATVSGNTLDGGESVAGIVNLAADPNITSNSFLCSNTATNCFGAGIQTQNWNGFAKLNEVSASDVGHLSQANDNGSLLFSRYYENTGPGLKSDDPSSVLDLSGKHSGSVNLAAYDTIDHNNIVGSAASGQIEWNGPRIKLGSINLNTTTFGRNSIIGNNSSDHLMFNSSSGSILIGGISSEGINNNFWGYGAWSSLTTVMLAGNSNGRLTPNISFSPNDPEYGTAPFIDPNTEECGEEFNTTSIIAKNPQSLSIQEYDTDRCNSLYDKGEGLDKEMKYAEAYDTLRLYIELCAMQQFAYFEFNTISGDLYLMGGDSSRFVSGRDWFKKVLYYNPDSNYYCADVIGLLRTFNFFEGRGNDYLGSLAVLKYLNDNHKCLSWYDLKHYDTIYSNTINQVISLWRDSVKDSIKTPLDTTLPSIDELGLGILRGPSRVGASSGPVSETIGNLALVENPFRTEAILRYRLNRGAMVRIDVYDVLGKQMRGEGEGYKHEDDYEFSFDTRSWASGTYFVRVSTMGGEVQTIKAIKK